MQTLWETHGTPITAAASVPLVGVVESHPALALALHGCCKGPRRV